MSFANKATIIFLQEVHGSWETFQLRLRVLLRDELLLEDRLVGVVLRSVPGGWG